MSKCRQQKKLVFSFSFWFQFIQRIEHQIQTTIAEWLRTASLFVTEPKCAVNWSKPKLYSKVSFYGPVQKYLDQCKNILNLSKIIWTYRRTTVIRKFPVSSNGCMEEVETQLLLFGLFLHTQPLNSSEQHTRADLEFSSDFEKDKASDCTVMRFAYFQSTGGWRSPC